MVREVCRRLHHTPGVARGAHATAFAGKGHKVVVAAVVTPGSGKAVGKDAAFQIFAKGLADIGPGAVVVALAVELAGTGKFMPSLEVLGYGLVQQSPLGVARVVGLGFGARLPARMRMRLRWACGGGHGAVPAWAGCLMLLVLYPASSQAEPTTGRANTPDLIASCAHFTRDVARFGSHTDAQPVPHRRATTIGSVWQ